MRTNFRFAEKSLLSRPVPSGLELRVSRDAHENKFQICSLCNGWQMLSNAVLSSRSPLTLCESEMRDE